MGVWHWQAVDLAALPDRTGFAPTWQPVTPVTRSDSPPTRGPIVHGFVPGVPAETPATPAALNHQAGLSEQGSTQLGEEHHVF